MATILVEPALMEDGRIYLHHIPKPLNTSLNPAAFLAVNGRASAAAPHHRTRRRWLQALLDRTEETGASLI
jgi:hypothetical protein